MTKEECQLEEHLQMRTGIRRAETWISRSFFVTPVLWAAGALFWLVPLTSPHAAGHSLYVVPLVIWPFLVLLTI